MFGKPFPDTWINGFIENVQPLKNRGWYWKIYTPNKIESKGNVEFIPMNIDDFNELVDKKTGVFPHNYIDQKTGCPKKLMTDYAPALAELFEEQISDFDFWGHCNWDVVYGRLDKWLPDKLLKTLDIFGNDPEKINGVFSIYRNKPFINTLYKRHPGWRGVFVDLDTRFAFEEDMFSPIVNKANNKGELVFKSAWWLENDRMPWHKPHPILKITPDGDLLNKNGEEMMLFHFSDTKKWPI